MCVFAATGCRSKTIVPRAVPALSAIERLSPGATLALPRVTPGVARIALWIERGSRMADPPGLASVAAWWIGERVQAEPIVLPDAIAWSAWCDTAEESLRSCAGRLTAALDVPPPPESDLARLRKRLRSTRQRAEADEARIAVTEAIHALLGSAARGLFPLGEDHDDGRVTGQALRSFMRQEIRVEHALLVGAGDVTDSELAAVMPAVRGPSSTTLAELEPAPGVRLNVRNAKRASSAFAMVVPEPAVGAAIAGRLRVLDSRLEPQVVRLRGLSLLIVEQAAGSSAEQLEGVARELSRLSLESTPEERPPRSDDLAALTREVGMAWATRSPPATARAAPFPLGVSALVAAGPLADDTALEERRAALEEALARGVRAGLGPALEGQDEVQTRLDSGATLRVRRDVTGRWMSAVLRFSLGAADDPEDRPGRAALLAKLLADGCERAHSQRGRWQLLPLVAPRALGLQIVAPSNEAESALDALTRCALAPPLGARPLEDARVALLADQARLGGVTFAREAARALLARERGRVAALGSSEELASVALAELRKLHSQALASGVTLWAVSERPANELARFAARRLSARSGAAPAPGLKAPSFSAAPLTGVTTNVRVPTAVVALGAPLRGADPGAARAVARALASALEGSAGHVPWRAGGADEGLAWAALAVETDEQRLPLLEAKVRALLGQLAQKEDTRLSAALARETLARRAGPAAAESWGVLAFEGLLDRPFDAERGQGVARALLAGQLRFAILRPAL